MMKDEIGSEFWDVPIGKQNNLFDASTEWFLSGRSALCAIIDENHFESIAVPFWCCDSILIPFVQRDIRIVFYHDKLPDTDAALVMNYFGYRNGVRYEDYPGTVICDVTHSVFTKQQMPADYYFGSLRKWAGFWTGGFAIGLKEPCHYQSINEPFVQLRKQAMNEKKAYIEQRSGDKNRFLKKFQEAEECIENCSIGPADARDIELAGVLDVDFLRTRRQRNAKILVEAFRDIVIYPEVTEEDCPLFVPVRIRNRDALRKFLIEQKIYCPVHWPISKYHNLTDQDLAFYNEELSLVCDQRYGEQDMFRMVETITDFIKER